MDVFYCVMKFAFFPFGMLLMLFQASLNFAVRRAFDALNILN